MKLLLLLSIIIVSIGLLIRALRRRSPATHHVASSEIPEILAQLQVSAREGNASVLTLPSGGEGVQLQFSIDHGVVGLDWVLVGHRNLSDKSRIAEMATALGYHVEECEQNQVRQLRITGQGIAELGTAIIRDFYGIHPAARIPMVTVGFRWDPEAHWN
ncbi:hypothetical protein [Geothrix sp. 21YS21S-2]|uniref:hypothetical protein n=1 Tax=Geothrix sp. 21YS21S-2 TaxID=3068893 RepID=UPI0027B91BF0|nr:hypothetical protein [Geothrix sp. 21YS21S-2]